MVEINDDLKTMDIAINIQRVFNPLRQDPQIGNFNVAIGDLNVSSLLINISFK